MAALTRRCTVSYSIQNDTIPRYYNGFAYYGTSAVISRSHTKLSQLKDASRHELTSRVLRLDRRMKPPPSSCGLLLTPEWRHHLGCEPATVEQSTNAWSASDHSHAAQHEHEYAGVGIV
ncbi:hypothetical protein VTO42DRAFT_7071 [Malbranchea cinnamomea]